MEFLRASFVIFLSFLLVKGFPNNSPMNHDIPDHLEVTNITQKSSHLGDGQDAELGQFPWHVAIYNFNRTTKDFLYLCGGSIISENWVLTAMHCFNSEQTLYLNYNTVKIEVLFILDTVKNNQRNDQGVFNLVKTYIPNEKYDIALIRAASPIKFSDTVQPIPLASRDIGNLQGKEIVITGYGFTKTNGRISEKLQYGRFEIIKHYQCPESRICSKGLNNAFTCDGDSGGPVAYEKSPKKWVLVGVHVAGSNELCEIHPHKHMKITYFLDWIEKVTGIRP